MARVFVRRPLLVIVAAVGFQLLGLAPLFGPLATAPAGAQPAPPGGSQDKYYLVNVTVKRTNITGIGVTNTSEKAPDQVFNGNPGTIKFTVQRPKYTLDGSLTVVLPPVAQVGQPFNVSFLAVGAWNLNEADGRLQIQRTGDFQPPNQQDENLENAPPGSHTLTMDKPSQQNFDTSNETSTLKNGVRYISFPLQAAFNTQGHGDSVQVQLIYTYANDPNLAGKGGTGSTTSPPPVSCPPTFDGVWHDQGPSGGGRKDPGRELGTWGKWIFQQNGNNATGTIDNVGGTFGKGTFTGTVSGKTFSGTWTAGNAGGKVTATRSDDDCTFTTTWTIDNPPGQTTGGTTTVGRPPTGGGTGGATGGGTGGATAGGTGGSTGGGGGGGSGNPWDTAAGQNCFEQWIALATRLINAADLGPTYGPLKPYSFNQYGILVDQETKSAYAPDDWERHNRNKYWWMWDYYNTDNTGGQWTNFVLKTAKVPPLRDYVRQCASSTSEPPLATDMVLDASPDRSVAAGTEVLVLVYLRNATDVLNMDFSLTYDPSVVTARPDAEKGSLISDIFEYKLNDQGVFKFNFAQLTPINGTGTVAGFRFLAVGAPGSRTPLTLAVHTVNNSQGQKLPIRTINGSITIYDPSKPPVTGTTTGTGTGTGTGSGTGTATGTTTGGTPTPPTPVEPTCSGTGRQTMDDALCCLKIWVGLTPNNPQMDLDGNGVVDSRDAVIVMQNVLRRLGQ